MLIKVLNFCIKEKKSEMYKYNIKHLSKHVLQT